MDNNNKVSLITAGLESKKCILFDVYDNLNVIHFLVFYAI